MKVADLTVSRGNYANDSTTGRIFSHHFKGYIASLELPWQNNHNRFSCIPEGLYPYRIAWSNQAKREVIWIDEVPGRTLIQIHPGNYTRQILGCCLPGTGITDMDNDGIPDVTSSGPTMDKILAAIPRTGYIRFTQSQKPVGVFS